MKIRSTLGAVVFAITCCYDQATTTPTQTGHNEEAIRPLVTIAYGTEVNSNEAPYAAESLAGDVLWTSPDTSDRTDKIRTQNRCETHAEGRW